MPKLKVRSRVGDSCRNRLRPAPKTVQMIVEPMDTGRHTASTVVSSAAAGSPTEGDGGDQQARPAGLGRLDPRHRVRRRVTAPATTTAEGSNE